MSVFSDLIQKVDYFKKLNANALLLSNIVNLSSGFQSINNNYGSIEEFRNFLNYSKSKNIRILMDFIPNYTTDEHEWFLASLKNNKYRGYYIW